MAKEFKTIEDAQKAFAGLSEKYASEVEAHKKTKAELADSEKTLKDEKKSHEATKAELKTAQGIAEDAISKANEAIEKSDPNVYVTFNKENYRINFGVNGKNKEEVREDKGLVAQLVKNGSGALTKV